MSIDNLKDPRALITQADLDALGFSGRDVQQLLASAETADRTDRELTIMQALRKYPKAAAWSMALSVALIMEGYDLVVINSFYGQRQFSNKFGDVTLPNGNKTISPAWMSGLSNGSIIGQMIGLGINGWAQDRFGCRKVYMAGMLWMVCTIFLPVFAHNIQTVMAGQVLCGTAWGMFQTLTTAYACEVVPTRLRAFVTAFVCMCWGIGIILSSGVVRAMNNLPQDNQWAWRIPFMCQWIWPLPLFLVAFMAPESPWNSVRRGKYEEARSSLRRLRGGNDVSDADIDNLLAQIVYTTRLEDHATAGSSYWECFRGTNLRRTEINCMVWMIQVIGGNPIISYAVVFLQRAGFSETASFNLNLIINCTFIIGGIINWGLMTRLGRSTIYMGGMTIGLILTVLIGVLGCLSPSKSMLTAMGAILVIDQLSNLITLGPTCYPIVAETPSGKLRAKTISVGRFCYNIAGILNNSLTPRMISATGWNWGPKAAFFWAGTNLLVLIWAWFRLPETKDRTFGEIDLLFEHKIPARKFKHTKVDEFAVVRNGSHAFSNGVHPYESEKDMEKATVEMLERI